MWLGEAGRDARATAASLGELAATAALGGPDRGLRVVRDPARPAAWPVRRGTRLVPRMAWLVQPRAWPAPPGACG